MSNFYKYFDSIKKLSGAAITPEEEKRFKENQLNKMLKSATGAAATEEELERLKKLLK